MKKIATITLALLSAQLVYGMEERQSPHQASIPATFKEVQTLFETYKKEHNPHSKSMIIIGLSKLMNDWQLKDGEKAQAIKIADELHAANLKVRLEKYKTEMRSIETFPEELVRLIINHLAQGASVADLKSLLHVNKSFNYALLKAPVNLDLSYHIELTDNEFGKIVELFPNMVSLNISHTKLTMNILGYLKALKKLSSLSISGLNPGLVDTIGHFSFDMTRKAPKTIISSLPNTLKELNLSGIILQDEDIKLISQSFPSLESLYLGDGLFTDNSLSNLYHLKHLKVLSIIGDSFITENGVNKFKQAASHVHIEYKPPKQIDLDNMKLHFGNDVITSSGTGGEFIGHIQDLYTPNFESIPGFADLPITLGEDQHISHDQHGNIYFHFSEDNKR
jgi:hypothetical protein